MNIKLRISMNNMMIVGNTILIKTNLYIPGISYDFSALQLAIVAPLNYLKCCNFPKSLIGSILWICFLENIGIYWGTVGFNRIAIYAIGA